VRRAQTEGSRRPAARPGNLTTVPVVAPARPAPSSTSGRRSRFALLPDGTGAGNGVVVEGLGASPRGRHRLVGINVTVIRRHGRAAARGGSSRRSYGSKSGSSASSRRGGVGDPIDVAALLAQPALAGEARVDLEIACRTWRSRRRRSFGDRLGPRITSAHFMHASTRIGSHTSRVNAGSGPDVSHSARFHNADLPAHREQETGGATGACQGCRWPCRMGRAAR